jgi:uncharacterized protein YkwD
MRHLRALKELQGRAVAAAGALPHSDFATRMAAFGIKGVVAESLSAGRASLADAIAGWKASKGHNENLLLPAIRRIAIARIDMPDAGYRQYWALVLAR